MSSDDATPAAAASREVRLPPFSTIDPAAWFLRAEVQFRLKRVTSSETKADYVLASLADDVFAQLTPWLKTRGDEICYEDLKKELLTRFTASPEAKAERLLQLLNQPLGDERPSLALEGMRSLATITGPKGDKQLDVIAVIWLNRLPTNVRAQITNFTSLSSAELGTKADSLMDAARAATTTPVNQVSQPPPATGSTTEPQPAAAATQQKRDYKRGKK